MTRQQIDYEKLLFLYSCALEDGDFEAIHHILSQAEHDAQLMTQLREIDSVYQAELPSPRVAEMRVPVEVSPVKSANGHIASAAKPINLYPSHQPKPHRGKTLMRIAILILTILGGLFTYLGSYQNDSPVLVTEIPSGQSATMLPQADRVPITTDNADQLTLLATYGETRSDYGAVWSTDGSQILVYGSQGILVYDAETFEVVDTVDMIKPITRLKVNPRKSQIALTNDNNELIIINWETQEIIAQRKLPNEWTLFLEYSPNGEYLVTSDSRDTDIYLWDAETTEPYMILRGIQGEAHSAVFSPDSRYVTVNGLVQKYNFNMEEGEAFREIVDGLMTWDVKLGTQVGTYLGKGDYITSLTYGNTNQQLIATDSRGRVMVWDNTHSTKPDNVTTSLTPQFEATVIDTDVIANFGSQFGMWLSNIQSYLTISTGRPTKLNYWNIDNMEQAEALVIQGLPNESTWGSYALHPDGNHLMLRYADMFLIVDLSTQMIIHEIPIQRVDRSKIAFNQDTSSIALGGQEGVIIWDVETGDEINRADNYYDQYIGVISMRFVPDNPNSLLIGGHIRTYNGIVNWDIQTDDMTHFGYTHPNLLALDINTKSQIVVIEYNGELRVLGQEEPLSTENLNKTPYFVFSNPKALWTDDGNIIVKDYTKVMYIFDGETGDIVAELPGHIDVITDISLSSDCKLLASVDYAGTLILWDTTTWEQLTKIYNVGELDNIGSVSIASDNRLIAISGNGKVVLWDSQTQTTLATLENTGIVEFSPDGTLLATIKNNGVALWGIPQ